MRLTVKNITKSYGKKQILKGVNYEFESGKIYGLLGRNGAGKTTFFNCVNKDILPDTGEIYLDGKALDIEDIGYVVSTPVVPVFLTAREFLKFFIDINIDKVNLCW